MKYSYRDRNLFILALELIPDSSLTWSCFLSLPLSLHPISRFSFLQHEGSQTTSQSAVDKDTTSKLDELNSAFEKNRKDVVAKLLERVTKVEPELHRNFVKSN